MSNPEHQHRVTMFKMSDGHHGWCKLCGELLQGKANGEHDYGNVGIWLGGIPLHPECLHNLSSEVKILEFNIRNSMDEGKYTQVPFVERLK